MKGVMFVEKGQAAIIEEEMPVCGRVAGHGAHVSGRRAL